jgi:hypothetical protein
MKDSRKQPHRDDRAYKEPPARPTDEPDCFLVGEHWNVFGIVFFESFDRQAKDTLPEGLPSSSV